MPKSKFVQWVERGITEVSAEDLGDIATVGENAFYLCRVTSVVIPNSVTNIASSAFFGCSSLMSITIPGSVTSIGSSAFSRCSSLTSITIHDGVKSIGNSTFQGCSALTGITIPASVTSIDNYVFYSCNNLIYVEFLGQTPPSKFSYTFSNIPDNCIIIVPPNASNAYKTAWSDVADRIYGGWQEYYYTQMNFLADSINTKVGTTGTKTINELTTAVTNNLIKPTGNQDISTLNSYNVQDKATAEISEVEKNKIIPGNIRNGVEILGVTGSYSGSSSLNDLIGCSTIYLDPYHITHNGTSQSGDYFTAYDVEDPSEPGSSGEFHSYRLYWDSYSEELDGDETHSINGHTIQIVYVLRCETITYNHEGMYGEPTYNSYCYRDSTNCYWVTSIISGVYIASIHYVDNSYIPLFSNTPISYGNYSKTNNLSSYNIKSGIVIGADATVHNAGVLGRYSGEGVDHDLTNTSTPYINTYDMRWLTMFSSVSSGSSTVMELDVTAYDSQSVSEGATNILYIIAQTGSTTVNGYTSSFTHILEYQHICYDTETGVFNHTNIIIAYYDRTTNKIYWTRTFLPEGEGLSSLSINHVTYADSTYRALFSASSVAFGGFLVNTNANTIKDTIVVGSDGNVNQGIKGTFSGPLYDISDTHVVYINPYHSLWSTLVSQNTVILEQYCDYGPNPWDTDPEPMYHEAANQLYWASASGSTTVNGFTVAYTRRLTYKYDYWQENPEDPALSYLDTAYAPIAYYDGTKIYWETTVLNMASFYGVISITYGNSTYKYLFANSLAAYGNFIYKDSDLIPANVRENTIIGENSSNAGIKGALATGEDIRDLIGASTIYLDAYSSALPNIDNLEYGEHTLLTFSTSDIEYGYINLYKVDEELDVDLNGYYTSQVEGAIAATWWDSDLQDDHFEILAYYYSSWNTIDEADPNPSGWVWASTSVSLIDTINSVNYGASSYKNIFSNQALRSGYTVAGDSLTPTNLLVGAHLYSGSNLGVYGTHHKPPTWLDYGSWNTLAFNAEFPWDTIFGQIENEIQSNHSSYANDTYSITISEGGIVNILRTSSSAYAVFCLINGIIIPIYAAAPINEVIRGVTVTADAGWNSYEVQYSGSTFPYFNWYVHDLDDGEGSFVFDLTPYITNFIEPWAGKKIAFGDYSAPEPAPQGQGTLIITRNGAYDVKDLLQYEKVVININPDYGIPTVSAIPELEIPDEDKFSYVNGKTLNLYNVLNAITVDDNTLCIDEDAR